MLQNNSSQIKQGCDTCFWFTVMTWIWQDEQPQWNSVNAIWTKENCKPRGSTVLCYRCHFNARVLTWAAPESTIHYLPKGVKPSWRSGRSPCTYHCEMYFGTPSWLWQTITLQNQALWKSNTELLRPADFKQVSKHAATVDMQQIDGGFCRLFRQDSLLQPVATGLALAFGAALFHLCDVCWTCERQGRKAHGKGL